MDMKGGRFSPGQAYVAFNPVKTLYKDCIILNFNLKAIKISVDVETEMARLNSNLLQPIPEVLCDPTLPFTLRTIALLNVRSLLTKVPDIKADRS